MWVVKPGENSNRGQGIKVESNFKNLCYLIQTYCTENSTVIIQKYISNPLLYRGRKFDVRVFCLVTSINGKMKAFFYKDGYLRTSSKEYQLTASTLGNKFIHLVNDAVQKHGEDYGKYENGNKLSFDEFQDYLDDQFSHLNIDFRRDLIPQI